MGLFLQVLISNNGKPNVKRFSWFFIVPFLLFLLFNLKAPLYDNLGTAALFAIMIFVPFYGKEMLPAVTEQTLLSHTLIFWAVFLISGSKSAISLIAIPLTLGTLIISFINVRLNLFFKYIFYVWHLIIVISLITFGGMGKGLTIFTENHASSNSLLNISNPGQMILYGMAAMYLIVNIWYASISIFPFLHTYAHFLRDMFTGKFIRKDYNDKEIAEERKKIYRERFSDEQVSPSVSMNIIVIFGIIFGLNYKLEIVPMIYPVILWFIFAPRLVFSVGSKVGTASLQNTQAEHKPLPSFIRYPLSIIHRIRQFISPMFSSISRLHVMFMGDLKKLLIAGVGAIFILEIIDLSSVLLLGETIGGNTIWIMLLSGVSMLILENKLGFFDKRIEHRENKWFFLTIFFGWLYVASANSTVFWDNSIYPFGMKLLIGGSVKEISVTEAPQYRNASVFYFRDGIAIPILEGNTKSTYTRGYGKGRGATRHLIGYSVIPVVQGGWKEDDPIPLWLVYEWKSRTGKFMWIPPTPIDEPLVVMEDWSGITVDPSKKYYYKEAISDSEKKYNIKSHPDAALIYYSETPEAEKFKRITFAFAYFFLPKVLWVIVAVYTFRKDE